ncbi:MAG TPA: HemK2/MTQ2 family protein methyltransferase [Candidatus Nitrosotalea sp.]|nr:HemK2/MTQ2 family protein methyltransferase [Candidatus Nitrosotalea sp.]
MQRKLSSDYYQPAEDTFFLADFVKKEKGGAALDIGTGSGFLARVLSEGFGFVVATDISPVALKKARESVPNCICCKSADAINYAFDLVVCNLPYLPSQEVVDEAVDGLREGLVVPTEILLSASCVVRKHGKLIYLTSSLANFGELMRRTEKMGFEVKVASRKKLFFEELVIVECIKI